MSAETFLITPPGIHLDAHQERGETHWSMVLSLCCPYPLQVGIVAQLTRMLPVADGFQVVSPFWNVLSYTEPLGLRDALPREPISPRTTKTGHVSSRTVHVIRALVWFLVWHEVLLQATWVTAYGEHCTLHGSTWMKVKPGKTNLQWRNAE